jgi:hypothetical protein
VANEHNVTITDELWKCIDNKNMIYTRTFTRAIARDIKNGEAKYIAK